MRTRLITFLGALTFSLSCPLSLAQSETEVGINCFRKNDFKGAMTHFNKTLKTSPTDYNALYYSAIIYHRTGSVDQAKNTYGKLIKLYPNSDAARNALAALRYLDPKYASKFPGAYSSLPTRSSATASAGRAWSGGQSGGSTEVTSGPAESQIFFEDRGNAMVVDAYVNNRPVKMIFDTGAEAVVFGKNHLNELGIDVPKGEATGLSFGVGDGGAQRAWNTTATIKLGQIEKRNCPIAVHEEMPTLPLLGQTFFKDFQYSIQRGQGGTGGSIRFRRKDASSAQSIAHDSNAVPFSRQGNEIVVPVEINGRQTRMFFDTGAEQCVFSEAQLQQLGITVPEDAVEGRSIGIAGSTATKTFTVARMRLGSVEKTNVPISMVESYHMPLPLLGQTFFGDLRCELDNDAHLLRLRR